MHRDNGSVAMLRLKTRALTPKIRRQMRRSGKTFSVEGFCRFGWRHESDTVIENAPRQRSRRHAAVEDLGCDSEDTEADEAEWQDILATMGDGEGDGVEVTDDERVLPVLPDPLVECFTRSGRRVKRPKRD